MKIKDLLRAGILSGSILLLSGCTLTEEALDKEAKKMEKVPTIVTLSSLREQKKRVETEREKINYVINKNVERMLDGILDEAKKEDYKYCSFYREEGADDFLETFCQDINREESFVDGDTLLSLRDSQLMFIDFDITEETNSSSSVEAMLKEFEKQGMTNVRNRYEQGRGRKNKEMLLVRNGFCISLWAEGQQITLQGATAVIPEKYEDFVERNILDGFYISGYALGGKAEIIELTGSNEEPGNPWKKSIAICFKDGEPIGLEMTFTDYQKEEMGALFSENEIQTVKNLIGVMTADREKGDTFIDNLVMEETEGELGGRNYRIRKSNYFGGINTESGWVLEMASADVNS